MAEKRFYWLKLPEDFFTDNKPIKKLRKIAGGDTYTIIYLKMLLASLRNNGKLYYDGVEDNAAEEIALEIDEDSENVKVTIAFMKRFGLIQEYEDGVVLNELPMMVGSEAASTLRSRKCRENKQLLLQCNADATQLQHSATEIVALEHECNTERDREKEIDIRDKEISIASPEADACRTFVQRVLDEWNQIGVNQIKAIKTKSRRHQMLMARSNEHGQDSVIKAIQNIKESSFLRGQNERSWMITFDWFVKPANFLKVFEGNYKDSTKKATKVSPAQNFSQREYNVDDLMKKLNGF